MSVHYVKLSVHYLKLSTILPKGKRRKNANKDFFPPGYKNSSKTTNLIEKYSIKLPLIILQLSNKEDFFFSEKLKSIEQNTQMTTRNQKDFFMYYKYFHNHKKDTIQYLINMDLVLKHTRFLIEIESKVTNIIIKNRLPDILP